MALILGLVQFGSLIIAGVMEASSPGGIDEKAPVAIALGLVIIGTLIANLVGAVFAIVGLTQAERSRIFPILGLIGNGLALLAMAGIIVAGLIWG